MRDIMIITGSIERSATQAPVKIFTPQERHATPTEGVKLGEGG